MSYFQSPLHSHLLSLRNLSQHFQNYECNFCREDIYDINGGTSIYCCEKCYFFIHTSCATPPRQIQHPRHQHPLDLLVVNRDIWNRFNYRCVEFDRGCDFKLHSGGAMTTLEVEKYYCSVLREDSDGESTLQFAHEHPLTSCPVRTRTLCGGCEMQISEEEEAYGCSECRFFLHEACAKAPLEIQHHPFHPEHPLFLFYNSSGKGECHACRSQSTCYKILPKRIVYRCEECELIWDLSCVISTMPCEDDDDDEREDIRRRPPAIDHPLHPHRLSSYHSKIDTRIQCQYCEQRIRSGDFYGCSDCFFFLHGSCARPPADAIQHYLHPEHALIFAKYADAKERDCPICYGLLRRDSYCYTCEMCDFFIDPICVTTTLSDLEEAGGMMVKYSFHEHELYPTLKASGRCNVCEEYTDGRILVYRCFSQRCRFEIHKSCLQLPSDLEHPSHSLHPLTFCFTPRNEDIVCRICYKRIRGTFAFSCGECDFYLDVKCAQKPTLKHHFHEHLLIYFGEEAVEPMPAEGRQSNRNRKCRACRKSCRLDFFRCVHCDFSLHYECSQLPPTIKSEHHWEPLVLRESYKEDDWGPYYCDICERRRDPNKWVYFCETCETDTNYFVAHVECALSRVKLEVIEEDDFIRQNEHIQKREEEFRVAQEQVDAKEVTLRPLMAELESMRSKLELQRVELKELKTEHEKWIDMGAIEEDESIGGEEDIDSTYSESETLRQILEELETQQANWLIKFLKRKRCLPSDFSP
ncbi:hypothetical protein BT93_C1812 [Corymbia citriodora subsp. variegata]|nr:hypothetical protein BT93_C1812 [Corymbia citriodora subsp. variegata]